MATTMTIQTTTRLARILATVALVLASVVVAAPASAQRAGMPSELEGVGVDEHLDGQLPLDAMFKDHAGRAVKLGDVLDGKRPAVLIFAYHSCPVVCSMIANNLAVALSKIDWTLGKEFQVVTISIDPNEKLQDAAKKRSSVLAQYGRSPETAQRSWHFLQGDAQSITRAANAAGFKYKYDADQKQWAHASLVMIVKPDGRMARYLYGYEAVPSDVQLGLYEAADGRTISTVEKIILYCYHYDPKGGKYVLVATRAMQVGAGMVAVVLFTILGIVWLRELRKARGKPSAEADKTHSKADTVGSAAE